MKVSSAALILALAAPAAAQSFNIDVGPNLILAPAPPSSYGGAAGQPGHWMEFIGPFLTRTLEDLSGGTGAVTLGSDSDGSFTVFPSVIASAGDQELMEDAQWLPNLDVPVTWSFAGLINGDYVLYTYAADPASSVESRVEVLGSSDAAQIVGGPWTGAHQLGETYARHAVTVSDGTLTVLAMGWGAQPNNSGALNGFQLVHLGGGGNIGSSYCGPANLNSTGLPGVISAVGSDVAAQNLLILSADQLPTNQFGYFLASQTQDFVAGPGGSQGSLCLGGNIARFRQQIQSSGGAGSFSIPVDLTSIPTAPPSSVIAGETWNFQAWYRDVNPAATSNFTDGVSILFL